MFVPCNINVVVAFILLVLSVTIAENENRNSLCDVCQCSESEVKCSSLVDPHSLLTYDGKDVTRINITESDLGYLKKEHFSKFQNISSVFLNSNKLIIDSSSFSLLIEVTTLNLDNNSIEVFATGMFDANTKLMNLSLNNNGIKLIPNDTFKQLGNLRKLYLANNTIEEIDSDAFRGLSALEELDLGGNKLQRVAAHAFSPLATLRVLILRDNLLEEVEEGAWSGLEASLEELDLSGNRLLRAEAALAAAQAPLRVLRLGRNNITSFGSALVEVLAQRPALSAQLRPNPLRCACGELRDAWVEADAQGLLKDLVCASGRPWDTVMRNISCNDTNGNSARIISPESKNSASEIVSESTLQASSPIVAETSSSNSSFVAETISIPSNVSSINKKNNESAIDTKSIPSQITSNIQAVDTEKNSNSHEEISQDIEEDISDPGSRMPANPTPQHGGEEYPDSRESGPTKPPVEIRDEDKSMDNSDIQDTSTDSIQSPDDDTTTNLNPAQLVALAEGIEMADAIWQLANTAQLQPSDGNDVKDGNLTPAQQIALAEGVEMAEAVAQAAKEVEPSINAIWRATLEAESSFKQNNAPQFEESLDTALMTLLVCVLIVLSVSGSAVAIVMYHKLRNTVEEDASPPNLYVLLSDSESRGTSVESSFSDIRGVSYSFPTLDEVTLS